jgi:class 3 adenylate cyclase/tetratricopeptide (TPR) repeat protein
MEISDWLRGLQLAQYEGVFRENAIDIKVLPELIEADLEKLGVLLGHRKRMLRAIAALANEGPPHAAAEVPAGRPDSAERRRLSVMFCDIVGSTALSTRLDPEDLSAVVRAFQVCVRSTIARFGGFIARYMGDGVLIYFGWPAANETDAERTLRAALAVIAAVGQTPMNGERLSIRIGVATGLVIVGAPIGEGDARQQTAIGETPNLAARLQALAAPDTLVIDDNTRSQIGSLFELVDLGPQRFAGFPTPQHAWRVIRESGSVSRFEALRSHATPLIGRNEELELLQWRWQRAMSGEGRFILISGEPGIGKSRLVAALLDHLPRGTYFRLRYFCSPHHTDSALYPIARQLERAAGFERGDSPAVRLNKLETLLARAGTSLEDMGLLADLLSLPHSGRYPALDLTPQRRRRRVLDALAGQLDALAAERPVLMIFEDAHWADPTSLEVLEDLLARIRRLPVLVLVTFRPEFTPHWAGHPQVTSLTLSRLGPEESAALVRHVAGDANLSKALLEEIIERADGMPLFAEELTKSTLEVGHAEANAHLAAAPSAQIVPPTLYTSLMARLDRLHPGKELAQIGAAIGREFSHELIGIIAARTEPELQLALDQLVNAALIFVRGTPPDTNYLFKHALLQDVAYGTLLRAPRQELHGRIAEVLEQHFPETVETRPELLAYHLTRAGLAPQAVRYWLRAGESAASVGAHKEAIAHLQAGINSLQDVPDSPEKLRLERDLTSAKVAVLQVKHGYGSDVVGTAIDRVLQLCRRIGEENLLPPILFQSWLFNHMRASYVAGRPIAIELDELAAHSSDPAPYLAARFANGMAHFAAGEFVAAFRNLTDGGRTYHARGGGSALFRYGGFAVGPACSAYASWAQATLGYCEQALAASRTAVEVINQTKQNYTMARGPVWCSFAAATCRDWETAYEFADRGLRIADKHGFEMPSASAMAALGLARAMLEPDATMPSEVRDGMARYAKIGGRHQTQSSFLFTVIAEAWAVRGEWDAVKEALARATEMMTETGERQVEAEIYRLQGTLLGVSGNGDPEPLFLRALEVARAQEARLYELRAARSLAMLWRDCGEPERAHGLLAPVYGWFTEGFGMADLVEARLILDQLSQTQLPQYASATR